MPRPRVAVAASGGRDSTALLHATLHAGRALGIEVVALHVHHGLQPAADGWLRQVQGQARRWGADFLATRLSGQPGRGDSVEAWARRERYRALAAMASSAGCSLVLLAHHRRDQAETFLLQALRGSGPRGLAAMPRTALRGGLTWARPWLDLPREAIEAYVRRHRLAFANDASNANPRFARNALRAAVWPALTAAFPHAEQVLASAAVQASHAAALAAEVAEADLAAVTEAGQLLVASWLAMPPARRRNALAAWLTALQVAPASALLERLSLELPAAAQGRWPAGDVELRLYRGRLGAGSPGPALATAPVESAIELDRAGRHAVAGFDGSLVVEPAVEGGLAAEQLRRAVVRARQGGERLRLSPGGLPRSLKKQYQARGVPAWERDGPLVFAADGRLLFAPGLGADASLLAEPGAPRFTLRWVPGKRQPAK